MAQAGYSTLVVSSARPDPEDRSVEIGQLAPGAIGTFGLVRIPVQAVGDDSLKTEPKGFWRNWLGRILGGK